METRLFLLLFQDTVRPVDLSENQYSQGDNNRKIAHERQNNSRNSSLQKKDGKANGLWHLAILGRTGWGTERLK
jgi:hypothetical protein